MQTFSFRNPKTLLTLGAILVLVVIGGIFLSSKIQFADLSQTKDEVTGTWRGEGTTKEDYKWFVEYTFKNGTYDMRTDSTFKDNGTYVITKKFEDGVSIQMTKTSIPFAKTYDIFLTLDPNGEFMTIEGMRLNKVK